MFSKWVLIAFLFKFLIKSKVECAVGDNNLGREKKAPSFMSSITNIAGKIKKILFDQEPEYRKNKKMIAKSNFAEFLNKNTIKQNLFGDNELKFRLRQDQFSEQYYPKLSLDSRPEMNTEQLIAAHGFLSESHTVITKDGYMLTMHRVLRDFGKVSDRVVMLHHGILGSSEDWLLLGPNKALPYMLIENGYDVWLLNARGNRYSRVHASKPVDFSDFWDFSWHEMGVYDLPAAIIYISEVTKSTELNFIGHSMGATALLVLLSTKPEYNQILNSGTLLAPLAYMYHAKGPIKLLANLYRDNGQKSLRFLGQTEFMRNDVFPEPIIQKYCRGDNRTCLNPLLLFGNGGSYSWEEKITGDVLAHVPAGGSVKTVLHYVQLVKSGYFQMFDFGVDGNRRVYKTGAPALYDLGGITLPIAFFSSASDWLATKSDIQTILPQLQAVTIHHVVRVEHFGHFDFVWSQDARNQIYNYILPLLDRKIANRT